MRRVLVAVSLALLLLCGIAWLRTDGEEGPAPARAEPAAEAGEQRNGNAAQALQEPLTLRARVPPDAAPAYERVVLITIDTLRADHLECYGYARETAPFLARLARDGVLFTRALATVSHTAPSHASILTGLPPSLHGVHRNGDQLPDDLHSLASVFSAAGFETAAFVSVSFLRLVAQGFDHIEARWRRARFRVNEAIEWLENGREKERFFLWVHLYDPHGWKSSGPPHAPIERVRASRPLATDELYSLVARMHGLPDPPPERGFEIPWAGQWRPHSRAEYVEHVDRYDALIAEADEEIERLHAAVEALSLPGGTLWIVTADHGEGIGSHGIAGHGARIYNEQLRVPLIFSASDATLAPRVVDELVDHLDLFPTLVELLGGSIETNIPLVSGRSLLSLARGEEQDWPPRLAFAQKRPTEEEGDDGESVALQSERHKLILHLDGREEFFDLAADPLELEDQGALESAAKTELRTELDRRLELLHQRAHPGTGDEELPEDLLEELRALGYVR